MSTDVAVLPAEGSEISRVSIDSSTLEQVLIEGNLAKLTPSQRVNYYKSVCESIGLNPLTKPFDYITLNGKLTLYAKRDASDQLRRRDRINVEIVGRDTSDDLYMVTARATTPDGRADESIGAVAVAGLAGEARANALMKAETKAKRRVTLSICGLGFLDETEIDSVEATPVVQRPQTRQQAPPATDDTSQPDYISQNQVKRLFAIAKSHSVVEAEMRGYVGRVYPYTLDEAGKAHLSRIKRTDYDDVCDALEAGLDPSKGKE